MVLCRLLCDADVAEVIISLHVLHGCDSNSGFYVHGKNTIYDGVASDPEAQHLLLESGETLPATDAMFADIIKLVLRCKFGQVGVLVQQERQEH